MALRSSQSVSPLRTRARASQPRIKVVDLILFSAWCGLAAGLLEVGARVFFRAIDPHHRLYMVSRHFLWLGPLSNLLFFLGIGFLLAVILRFSPRIGGWLGIRLICAVAVLPTLLAAGPQIYPEAWAILGVGFGVQAAPMVERHITSWRRKLLWTFVLMCALVLLLAGGICLDDRVKQARETGRPLPPANSPNVLLIVLDTVRADHLSLYGYGRATTPTLERLARRGIRFDEARATAPWTLPSHGSMFTGRWPHEVGDQWVTPLKGNFPTLADHLGKRGYATAGFVANFGYCSAETGLARGFTHYEDYVLEKLSPLRTAGLIEYLTGAITEMIPAFNLDSLRPLRQFVIEKFDVGGRKNAASINHAFLTWLSERQEPDRPFFAFLNFFDAHEQYVTPPGARQHFASYPITPNERSTVYELWPLLDKMALPPRLVTLARDSYDDCLSYLDEQLGLLLDELQRRGLLDRTLVVVTADHGEGFGDHNLFDHGESLYRMEIRVPLLILPPAGLHTPSVVTETVSLRDLPATVADQLGVEAGSPFPGSSLARFWRNRSPAGGELAGDTDPVVSELRSPNPLDPNRGRSPASRGRLISLARGSFVYIRNEGDGTEQLFDQRADPQEFSDRSGVESMQSVLKDFRRRLDLFRQQNALSSKK
jgi:arylsulfatase A-like enzyme